MPLRLFLASFLLLSCGYSNTQSPGGSSGGTGNAPLSDPQQPDNSAPGQPANPNLSYQFVRQKVFEPHCLRCHSAAGGNRGGVNLETYPNAKNFARAAASAVNSGFMPPAGPLAQNEKTILQNWVQAGAPETAAGQTPPSNSPGATPPAPNPGAPPTPINCDDLRELQARGDWIIFDENFYFDSRSAVVLRRHDECEED